MEKTKLLILRITNRCNLACKYCYAQTEIQKREDMSLETAIKAIDMMAKRGGRLKVQFTGGEPLLCIELMKQIVQYMKQEEIQASCSIQTNGTLLTPKVCALLKEMNCAVGVSLDGMGDANGLRVYPDGTASFQDVIEGIRNLGSVGMCCNINAVVSSRNQNRLGELVELAAYLNNVRGLGLDMFRPIGRGEKADYAPCMETLPVDLKGMLEKQKELSKLGVLVRVKELEKVRIMLQRNVTENCYCYAQTGYSIAVDPQGDIYPCSSFVGMKNMCMGNVEEGIQTSPEVPRMDAECLACEYAAICRGGCPAGRTACGGRNETDCMMHRTIIEYGRKEYA